MIFKHYSTQNQFPLLLEMLKGWDRSGVCQMVAGFVVFVPIIA
ncbi:hypothetical protein CEV32_1759 [Brucella rhizosphaerae]|uniref:Uncharacterized protein n=1 Tax=Brucella rhizosphaerae TaxID=571254 RepID=A0A256F3M1_9HYPH|nr:hypothetical protein CEV32_1759 [Brucella rhizosphaerae]